MAGTRRREAELRDLVHYTEDSRRLAYAAKVNPILPRDVPETRWWFGNVLADPGAPCPRLAAPTRARRKSTSRTSVAPSATHSSRRRSRCRNSSTRPRELSHLFFLYGPAARPHHPVAPCERCPRTAPTPRAMLSSVASAGAPTASCSPPFPAAQGRVGVGRLHGGAYVTAAGAVVVLGVRQVQSAE
jgi:hypothetical protein